MGDWVYDMSVHSRVQSTPAELPCPLRQFIDESNQDYKKRCDAARAIAQAAQERESANIDEDVDEEHENRTFTVPEAKVSGPLRPT